MPEWKCLYAAAGCVWYSPNGTPNLQALDRGGESLTNTLNASFTITAFIISELVSGFEEGRGYRRLRVLFLPGRLLGIFCPAMYLLYPRAVIRLTASTGCLYLG